MKTHLGKWVTQIKNNFTNGQKLNKMGDTKQLKCKRTNFQVLRSAIASSIALKNLTLTVVRIKRFNKYLTEV